MHDRERYRAAFQRSRQVVKEWEAAFVAAHHRKPNREELEQAPQQVLICYKNCKKIKHYFDKLCAQDSDDLESSLQGEPSLLVDKAGDAKPVEKVDAKPVEKVDSETTKPLSFSGLFSVSTEKKDKVEKLTNGIKSTEERTTKSGVWGKHLNRRTTSTTAATGGENNTSSQLAAKLVQTFRTSHLTASSTRTSLKKRSGLAAKSRSFFGSLGDETASFLGDLSQSSFLDDSQSSVIAMAGSGDSSVVIDVGKKQRAGGVVDDDDSVSMPSFSSIMSSQKSSVMRTDRTTAAVDTDWLQRCAQLEAEEPAAAAAAIAAKPKGLIPPAHLTGSGVGIDGGVEEKAMLADPVAEKRPSAGRDVDTSHKNVPKPTSFKGLFDGENLLTAASATTKVFLEADVLGEKTAVPQSQRAKRKRQAGSSVDSSENEASAKENTVPKRRKVAITARTRNRQPKVDSSPCSEEQQDAAKLTAPVGPSNMNIFALGFEESAAVELNRPLTRPDRSSLQAKMESGRANENYIKVNIKKKTFVRGRRGGGAAALRAEQRRKIDLKEGRKPKEYKCFRCGELGHFSKQCTGGKGDQLIPQEFAEEFDAGEFPSLEQARQMAGGGAAAAAGLTFHKRDAADSPQISLDENDEDAILAAAAAQFEGSLVVDETAAEKFRVAPLIITDSTTPSSFSADEISRTLAKFGYADFRPGQREGVERILSGASSLVLLATGSGKSLIYQLPAFLYAEHRGAITIVVSPLVSLMEDQVTGLPPFLRAAALHYNLTPRQKENVIEQVKSGRLHFLLVSPEAVAGGGGAFGALLPFLPPIAFVCIDEAHCVSQWSHNFRPSYLRLCKVVREKLGVQTILGLTATAPERMIRSVADQLGVPSDGIIRGPLLPANLTLTVSRDPERDRALLTMLVEGGPLADCDSVIVYCTRRDECERLAKLIRTHLQERDYQLAERRERRVRVSATAEPYHAGMTPSRRRTVQTHFMSGRLRVVVATVAFGMGIDKADIRAIVHYNMPKAFESYIQEIGRAGRDGLPARCHLFLDSDGMDLNELKRHIFSNSMDRFTIRKLLNSIFSDGSSSSGSERSCEYREVALPVADTVEQLDLPEENISTLLCYLEASSASLTHHRPWLRLANPVYASCKVQCYGGPLQLRAVACKCPPLAAAIAIQRQQGSSGMDTLATASSIEFPVVEVSARMGWNSAVVKKELKNLEWKSTPAGWRKSGVLVEFSQLAFHFEALVGPSEYKLDALLDDLLRRIKQQELTELSNLNRLFIAFSLVTYRIIGEETEAQNQERSDRLKGFIADYFSEPDGRVLDETTAASNAPPLAADAEERLRADVRSFVSVHQEQVWTGRAVARIFHGIASPNYPAQVWGRVRRFWRAHLSVDFNLLVRVASEEVLKLRTGS